MSPEGVRHPHSYALTLEAIGEANQSVQSIFAEHLPGILKRVSDKNAPRLSSEAYTAWAELLTQRVAVDRDGIRAAVNSVDYVLDRGLASAFPLIEVGLPSAYSEMERSASRRRLSQYIDGVARYFAYKDVPADRSMLAIFRTESPGDIIQSIIESARGRSFVRKAIDELKRSKLPEHRKIAAVLGKLDLTEGFFSSWFGW